MAIPAELRTALHHERVFDRDPDNSIRLRDDDVDAGRDVVRVLALGDSFTFGWGVEEADRFSEVVERRLRDRYPGKRFEFVNAGHWMYTFDQQLLTLRDFAPLVHPDLIIQGLYPAHVATIDEHVWTRDGAGRIVRVGYPTFGTQIRVNADGSLKRTNHLIEDPPLGSRLLAKIAQQFYRWRQLNRAEMETLLLLDVDDATFDNAWAKTTEAIRQTGAYADSIGVPYLAFLIPMAQQVDESEWFPKQRENFGQRALNPALPGERFRRAVTEAGRMGRPAPDPPRRLHPATLF